MSGNKLSVLVAMGIFSFIEETVLIVAVALSVDIHLGDLAASAEYGAVDLRYAGTDGYVVQILASLECRRSYLRYTVTNGYLLKALTALEGALTDLGAGRALNGSIHVHGAGHIRRNRSLQDEGNGYLNNLRITGDINKLQLVTSFECTFSNINKTSGSDKVLNIRKRKRICADVLGSLGNGGQLTYAAGSTTKDYGIGIYVDQTVVVTVVCNVLILNDDHIKTGATIECTCLDGSNVLMNHQRLCIGAACISISSNDIGILGNRAVNRAENKLVTLHQAVARSTVFRVVLHDNFRQSVAGNEGLGIYRNNRLTDGDGGDVLSDDTVGFTAENGNNVCATAGNCGNGKSLVEVDDQLGRGAGAHTGEGIALAVLVQAEGKTLGGLKTAALTYTVNEDMSLSRNLGLRQSNESLTILICIIESTVGAIPVSRVTVLGAGCLYFRRCFLVSVVDRFKHKGRKFLVLRAFRIAEVKATVLTSPVLFITGSKTSGRLGLMYFGRMSGCGDHYGSLQLFAAVFILEELLAGIAGPVCFPAVLGTVCFLLSGRNQGFVSGCGNLYGSIQLCVSVFIHEGLLAGFASPVLNVTGCLTRCSLCLRVCHVVAVCRIYNRIQLICAGLVTVMLIASITVPILYVTGLGASRRNRFYVVHLMTGGNYVCLRRGRNGSRLILEVKLASRTLPVFVVTGHSTGLFLCRDSLGGMTDSLDYRLRLRDLGLALLVAVICMAVVTGPVFNITVRCTGHRLRFVLCQNVSGKGCLKICNFGFTGLIAERLATNAASVVSDGSLLFTSRGLSLPEAHGVTGLKDKIVKIRNLCFCFSIGKVLAAGTSPICLVTGLGTGCALCLGLFKCDMTCCFHNCVGKLDLGCAFVICEVLTACAIPIFRITVLGTGCALGLHVDQIMTLCYDHGSRKLNFILAFFISEMLTAGASPVCNVSFLGTGRILCCCMRQIHVTGFRIYSILKIDLVLRLCIAEVSFALRAVPICNITVLCTFRRICRIACKSMAGQRQYGVRKLDFF